ncbi:MAG: undecaprenyldiphospho-muramoylpentapeptide beta-N-acetylglucosaminyltransferase [Lachnospiraceae bacterium]|nr:undecaprenyldiphospho-muramoylpentapeptide beta-N-acetylglucosaminyltransferase [Lachnospiraceae bacterium]
MKRIVMTGGGTAGHVTPNIALMPALKARGFEIYYIGSLDGIEKKLIEEIGIKYYGVSTGKFRRYFSLKNLTDPFRVFKGIGEARKILKALSPDVVFSKGGFVGVPVVKAARKLGIPCIIHESDYSVGLANKLCFSAAEKICCDFPETLKSLPAEKGVLTGSPVRKELSEGNAGNGRIVCGFEDGKPVLLIIGGSLGAAAVNEAVRSALPELLKKYNVIHICGKGKTDDSFNDMEGYRQFDYVGRGLADLFAAADIVISRAGANSIFELLALKKPNILIPLPGGRGDQLLNARSFEGQGYSMVIRQEELTTDLLVSKTDELFENKESYISAMSKSTQQDAIKLITDLIVAAAENESKD